MARKATGQVVEREGKRGRTYALRFRAYGQRQYVTLGTAEEGWTRQRAEVELENVLADVRRGIWRSPEPEHVPEERGASRPFTNSPPSGSWLGSPSWPNGRASTTAGG